MACTSHSAQSKIDFEVNKRINDAITADARTKCSFATCAIFGMPGVGKTTIFTNLLAQVGQSSRLIGADEHQTKRQIVAFLARQLLSLSTLTETLNFVLPKEIKDVLPELDAWSDFETYPQLEGYEERLLKAVQSDQLAEIWEKEIWSSRALKKVRLQRSFTYFRDRLPEILASDYQSSIADHLYLPRRTRPGYDDDFLFDYDDARVHVTVFGHMPTERRKWFPMISDMTFFVYVASLTDYDDQELWEDTLAFWSDLAHNPYTAHPPALILFLNKRDELKEKLKHCPYSRTCTGFDESDDLDEREVTEHIRARFLSQIPDQSRALVHETNGLSLQNIEIVWKSVRLGLSSQAALM
jgi:hypothetical protein